jgi:thiol-disulfide isomerase/thioredoxin
MTIIAGKMRPYSMLKISTRCFFQLFILILLLNTTCLSFAADPSLPTVYQPKTSTAKATLFEFSAPWCLDCQLVKPSVKKLTQEMGKDLNFIEFNIDDSKNAGMVKRYHILATPTFVLFNSKGQAVKRFGDDVKPQELRTEVLKTLNRKS